MTNERQSNPLRAAALLLLAILVLTVCAHLGADIESSAETYGGCR